MQRVIEIMTMVLGLVLSAGGARANDFKALAAS
jgi:cellobiose-specific phosphotransferase system component IIA